MSKKKVALIMGGYSGEAEVSYKSADNVYQHLDKKVYDVYRIDISPKGWYYVPVEGERQLVDRADFSIHIDGNKVFFDVALMMIHGTPGEDGKLQAYFDLLHIPYTSCDVTTSALTFNKRFTVGVAAFAGIHVAKSIALFDKDTYDLEQVLQLKFPVFIKPNNGGSSIGMSKVNSPDALQVKEAIAKAFAVDDQVLVEEFISGREFTIGVIRKGKEIIALPMTEILKPDSIEFFDFQAKYFGKNLEVTPAEASEEIRSKIVAAAKKVYLQLNCKGLIRIDFIYHAEEGIPYMLEVNTVPGQTSASLVPQQLAAMNWDYADFYATMIEEALISSK